MHECIPLKGYDIYCICVYIRVYVCVCMYERMPLKGYRYNIYCMCVYVCIFVRVCVFADIRFSDWARVYCVCANIHASAYVTRDTEVYLSRRVCVRVCDNRLSIVCRVHAFVMIVSGIVGASVHVPMTCACVCT